MELKALDWSIVGAYFVICLVIGLYFTKRASGSMNEFFLSGRSFSWWLAGTGMVATTFASDTPLAVSGLVAEHGLAGNWFWWSLAMGGMVTVFIFARLWRRSEVLTDLQLTEMRYGGKPAAALRGFRVWYLILVGMIPGAWVVGAILKVLRVTVFAGVDYGAFQAKGIVGDPHMGWLLASVVQFFSQLFNADPSGVLDAILIVALLGITGIYSVLSGMWGLALTDFFQFWLKLTGCIVLAVVAVGQPEIGGIAGLQEKMVKLYGEDQGQEIFRFIPDFTAAKPWLPVQIFLIMVLVQWWAGSYSDPAGGGYVVQRMASCRDEKQSLLATLWFWVAHYCLRPWPWIIVGFVALVKFPQIHSWVGVKGARDPGEGFPMVMQWVGPLLPGLAGLLIATFMAAFMSTMSSFINLNASYFINDFYKRFIVKQDTERNYARASQIASAALLVVGGVVAFWLKDVPIADLWNIATAVAAGVSVVSVLRWFWWRINVWVEFVAMITSLVIFSVLQVLLAYDTDSLPAWMGGFMNVVATKEYKMLIIAGVTTVAWVATMLLTKPEPTETLVAFYRKVRPGGPGWKPIAELCPDVKHDGTLGLSLVAVVVSSAMIFLILPGVGAIIFGQYLKAVAMLAGAGACAVVLFLLMNRMGWSIVSEVAPPVEQTARQADK